MTQKISDVSRASVKATLRRIYSDVEAHPSSATCSGFFWRANERVYCITNWHNVTGLRSDNLQPNGSFSPSHMDLEFKVFQATGTQRVDAVVQRTRRLTLYDKGEPVWIEHPNRHEIDVIAVAIPDEFINDGRITCINENNFEARWQPDIGADCFIVGYPEHLTGPLTTPIWKKGSIASEPRLDYEQRPVVLVDSLGNRGLSGAAVIAQASGVFSPSGSSIPTRDALIGTWQNFLGIYSGRLGDEGLGFQLGRVWKAHVIDEIVANGVRGVVPVV
jgi:hypothetical protein